MNKIASEKFRWMSFLCSVIIVCIHSSVIFGDTNSQLILFEQQLAIPAMPYFFLSSAYFRYRKYNGADYLPKLKKRIFSLLIPYVLWNIIDFIVCSVTGLITPSFALFCRMFVFVYIPGIDFVHEPMIGALWFVIRLLTYELVAPVIYWLISRKKVFFPVLIGLMAVVWFTEISYFAFIYWLPVYMIGAYISYHYHEKIESVLGGTNRKWIDNKFISILMILLAAAVYCIFVAITWKLNVNYLLRRWIAIPLLFLVMWIPGKMPENWWAVEHGSFFMFCAHYPARFLLGNAIVALNMMWGEAAYSQVYFATIIASMLIVEWILSKVWPLAYKALSGAR